MTALTLFLQQVRKFCDSAGFFVDDPFISMRFAANLVRYGELSFNHGTRVEGYSNFLHVIIHALCFRFWRSIPNPTAAIDIVCAIVFLASIAELIVLLALVRSAAEGSKSRAAWLLTLILTMAFWPFAYWAVAGLEAPLEGLLYLTLIFVWRHRSGSDCVRLCTTGLLLLGVTLIRFEGILIALGLSVTLSVPYIRAKKWGKTLALVTGVVLPGAAYHLFRWAYFGSILPNTYIAKATGDSITARLNAGAHYWGNWAALLGTGVIVATLLGRNIIDIHSDGALRQKTEGHSVPDDHFMPLALVVMKSSLVIFGGGDWMYGYRMLVPVTPLAIYLCLKLLLQQPRQDLTPLIRFTFAALLALSVPLLTRGGALPVPHPQAKVARGVRSLPIGYVDIGELLKRSFRPTDQVAIGEAGLIPFVAQDVQFMDLFGLVDADMAHQPGGMHTRVHAQHVLARNPDAVVFAHLTSSPPFGPYQYGPELLQSQGFQNAYRRVELTKSLEQDGWAIYVRRNIDVSRRGLAWSQHDAIAEHQY